MKFNKSALWLLNMPDSAAGPISVYVCVQGSTFLALQRIWESVRACVFDGRCVATIVRDSLSDILALHLLSEGAQREGGCRWHIAP